MGSSVYTSMEDTFKDKHIFAIFKSQYIPWLWKIVAGPGHYLISQMSLLEIKLRSFGTSSSELVWLSTFFFFLFRAFRISFLRSFCSQREHKFSILASKLKNYKEA